MLGASVRIGSLDQDFIGTEGKMPVGRDGSQSARNLPRRERRATPPDIEGR